MVKIDSLKINLDEQEFTFECLLLPTLKTNCIGWSIDCGIYTCPLVQKTI